MDVAMLISGIAKMGGPWLITALCVYAVVHLEKHRRADLEAALKRNEVLSDKLYTLGTTMAQVNTEISKTLADVERDVEAIRAAK